MLIGLLLWEVGKHVYNVPWDDRPKKKKDPIRTEPVRTDPIRTTRPETERAVSWQRIRRLKQLEAERAFMIREVENQSNPPSRVVRVNESEDGIGIIGIRHKD